MTWAERQIRMLLRAWPVSDRLERGNEIVGVSLDLVPEGHKWIPLALAADLLAGGLRARWRRRPPVLWWAYYRLGGRLPAKWRTWVYHDLTDPGWRRRIVVPQPVAIAIGEVVGNVVTQLTTHISLLFSWSYFPVIVTGNGIGCAVIALLMRRMILQTRDRRLAKYGFYRPAPTDPPWPPLPIRHSVDHRDPLQPPA